MGLLKSTAAIPLRVVPVPFQAVALTIAINHVLSGQSLKERLWELDNKSVSVHVLDIPWLMHFHIRRGRIRAAPELSSTDVAISGNLRGFLQLLAGREDPDTLFFQRRLNMEGDTATGVYIKNMLDALEYDWDAHFDSVLIPPLASRAKNLRRKIRVLLPGGLTQKPDGGAPG